MNIQKLDDAILGFFTWVAHAFQRRTGRNNYFLAKIMLFMMGGHLILSISNYFSGAFYPSDKGNTFNVVMEAMGLFILFMDSVTCDQASRDNLAPQRVQLYMNALLHTARARILISGLGILTVLLFVTEVIIGKLGSARELIWDVSFHLIFVALPCYLYLVEVTPLPPTRSLQKSLWGRAGNTT